jgi:hypothetical protein
VMVATWVIVADLASSGVAGGEGGVEHWQVEESREQVKAGGVPAEQLQWVEGQYEG